MTFVAPYVDDRPALHAAMEAGATVVTPNKRLARRLVVRYDAAQRAAGRGAWPAAIACPWPAWLETLWEEALAADALPTLPRLLAPGQSGHLWNRIVAAAAARAMPLVDTRGTAELAAEAWALVHAWGTGGESWRAWSGADGDPAAFAHWAETYGQALARGDARDAAQLADVLAGCAHKVAPWRGRTVVLAGFVEWTPQQLRLLAALEAAGVRLDRHDTLPATRGTVARTSGAGPRDELARALVWARERALAHPGAAIGIAVEDLATRRAEVHALAEEILCPALQWPGCEETPRPYDLSLGQPLAEVALVGAALDLIALAQGPLPVGRAAALLRSPYLAGDDDAWSHRAGIERAWLDGGRRDVTLSDVMAALDAADPALAGRWRRARGVRGPAGATSPRAWADAWRGWLAAVGWPGGRPLSSAEHQACGAWDELLVAFATLGAVEPRMARGEALAALRALATGRVFQPEAPRAPIQILGVLEAAGLPFDALWIAGLAAETWPPAPRPNPLLPYVWQRERDVPRATAARELARAQALTAQLVRGAPEVVVSHASRVDDHERVASALIVDFPVVETAAAATAPTARRMFDGRPAMERVADDRAPPVVAGTRLRGGASLVEAQGDCPFRAVAAHRLATAPWPAPGEGLSPLERGSLVHGALAAFWVDVRDHAALLSLPPEALDARIEAAVAIAAAKVEAVRWQALPPIVAAGEARRIAGLVRAWLEAGERSRPPFEVVGVEIDARLTRHDVTIGLRIDRLDRLADGGIAIIDYKTGVARAPAAWLALRPEAPQLGLYALARHDAAPGEPVRAVAYAQLKPGELKVQGIAADPDLWPALPEPAAVRAAGLADWPAVERRWEEGLGALFREIAEGVATVAPRDAPTTCRHCGLQSLCRIGTIAAGVEEGEADA